MVHKMQRITSLLYLVILHLNALVSNELFVTSFALRPLVGHTDGEVSLLNKKRRGIHATDSK
jgi:hypothetical protein